MEKSDVRCVNTLFGLQTSTASEFSKSVPDIYFGLESVCLLLQLQNLDVRD